MPPGTTTAAAATAADPSTDRHDHNLCVCGALLIQHKTQLTTQQKRREMFIVAGKPEKQPNVTLYIHFTFFFYSSYGLSKTHYSGTKRLIKLFNDTKQMPSADGREVNLNILRFFFSGFVDANAQTQQKR